MKKGRSKNKGNSFERECCKDISLFWTSGTSDSVFYRSDSSGGRATVRNKGGKKTSGQYGDLALREEIGRPLLELCTIEFKTGYPGQSPLDLIDKAHQKNTKYGEFFEQCEREREEANVPYWLLIARRKGKQKMIYMPITLYKQLKEITTIKDCFPSIRISFGNEEEPTTVFGTLLTQFFLHVRPKDICKLVGHINRNENVTL